jgi:hypothetical protein
MEEEPKPCPKCGSDNIEVDKEEVRPFIPEYKGSGIQGVEKLKKP